jgi:hypothetical protein
MNSFDFDYIIAITIATLLILSMYLFSITKSLQTEVDDLKIIIKQTTMPTLIPDKPVLGIE